MKKILVPFFSPISDKLVIQKLLDKCSKEGWSVIKPSNADERKLPSDSEVIWLFIGSGGTEQQVSEFFSRFSSKTIPLIITHDHYNSLPAGMEIRKYFETLGISTRIIHVHMDKITDILDKEFLLVEVKEKLCNFKLGLIGEVSDWLIASQIDPGRVKDKVSSKYQSRENSISFNLYSKYSSKPTSSYDCTERLTFLLDCTPKELSHE